MGRGSIDDTWVGGGENGRQRRRRERRHRYRELAVGSGGDNARGEKASTARGHQRRWRRAGGGRRGGDGREMERGYGSPLGPLCPITVGYNFLQILVAVVKIPPTKAQKDSLVELLASCNVTFGLTKKKHFRS